MPVVTRNRKNGTETKAEVPVKKAKKTTKATSKKAKKSSEEVEEPKDLKEEKKVEEPEKVEEKNVDEVAKPEEEQKPSEDGKKNEDEEDRTAEDDTKAEKKEEPIKIEEGGKCPDFKLPLNDGTELKLEDFVEKTLILYYYPKDSTPGCTTEAKGFSAAIEEFEKKDVTVIGVSADTAKSHCSFIEKQGLKFKLATDEKLAIGSMLGIKTNAKRQTFLIENGKFKKIWKKVSVKSHAKDVLAAL